MAKRVGGSALNFVAWLTGVIVSIAVGFALTEKVLELPSWLGGASAAGMFIAVLAGWVVIITTILSVVLVLLKQ